jgi:ribonuclease P protein component
MLSHLHRFHGHGSLRYLYRNGKTASSRLLSVKYNKNTNRVHPRFAVIVSKKVFKSAVKRNRLRRRVYEIMRRHLSEIKEPYDVAITVFSGELLVMPAEELEREIISLLAKESLLG